MQIILQATHGIVSGSPDFFRRAFGSDVEEFESLLLRPEKYLFNRDWYEEFDGKPEFDQFSAEIKQLAPSDKAELASLLSSSIPSQFHSLVDKTENARVKAILPWYRPLTEQQEQHIWKKSKETRKRFKTIIATVPDEELVEDAGLREAA